MLVVVFLSFLPIRPAGSYQTPLTSSRLGMDDGLRGVTIAVEESATSGNFVKSHFGHGILTWSLPYLFRTSPGFNLLVRGPANRPKDGASPLEGIVETDWSPATFTVNWMLTRPHLPVHFSRSEPIAMVVPCRRGELEAFEPARIRMGGGEREDMALYGRWRRERETFLRGLEEAPGRGSPHHCQASPSQFAGHDRDRHAWCHGGGRPNV